MSSASSVTGTVNVSPSKFLYTNLGTLVPKLEVRLIDTSGNIQFDTTYDVPSNNVAYSPTQIRISFQHIPKKSYCLKEILVEAVLANGSRLPFVDIVFSTDQPYMEEAVTYTITITSSCSYPSSISILAPTGSCSGGTPPKTS